MDINKATKAELASAFTLLQAENTKLKLDLQGVIQFANWLQANLQVIENLLKAAPFLNEKGQFFKKVYWVLTNFSKIKELIEEIFKTIRLWRERVDEMVANNNTPNGQSTTTA